MVHDADSDSQTYQEAQGACEGLRLWTRELQELLNSSRRYLLNSHACDGSDPEATMSFSNRRGQAGSMIGCPLCNCLPKLSGRNLHSLRKARKLCMSQDE